MKKHQKKFNKILHPNRHFIWALVLLTLSGAVLSAYIYVSAAQEDSDAIFPSLVSRRVFVDQQAGYAVKYPQTWQLEKDQRGNTVFDDPARPSDSITVAQTELKFEPVIRSTLNVSNEFDYVRSGVQYSVISSSSKDQTPDIDVAFVKSGGKMFYISGRSKNFEAFVRNFKPL